MLATVIILAITVGFFIGATTTVSIAWYLEVLAQRKIENKQIEPLVDDYVKRFGGTTEEAREIIKELIKS